MNVAIIPLIAAVVGLLMWILASNPKVSEVGKILFFCGVLVVLMATTGKSVHV